MMPCGATLSCRRFAKSAKHRSLNVEPATLHHDVAACMWLMPRPRHLCTHSFVHALVTEEARVADKAFDPVVVRSYKAFDMTQGPDIQGRCLAVDRAKAASGAGVAQLCLKPTVGGVSNQTHLCSFHLRRPLLVIEDFGGPTPARMTRYCRKKGHQKLVDISEFAGFATVCNAHVTGQTVLGRQAVVPAAGKAYAGVTTCVPRLRTLCAGPAGNPDRASFTHCDAVDCGALLEQECVKIGLCSTHWRVRF